MSEKIDTELYGKAQQLVDQNLSGYVIPPPPDVRHRMYERKYAQ